MATVVARLCLSPSLELEWTVCHCYFPTELRKVVLFHLVLGYCDRQSKLGMSREVSQPLEKPVSHREAACAAF